MFLINISIIVLVFAFKWGYKSTMNDMRTGRTSLGSERLKELRRIRDEEFKCL